MVNIFDFNITNFLGANKFTNKKLFLIKNPTFKNNVFDTEICMIVKTIYLKNINNCKKCLLWSYYRDRSCKNVNEIINKYERSNIIVNYSILPKSNCNKN